MQNEQAKEVLYAGFSAGPAKYRACILQTHGQKMTVLRNDSVSKDQTSWNDFIRNIEKDFPDHLLVSAFGLDDGSVGFYRVEIPMVSEKQLPAVITAQAEVLLPLPSEQMQYHWQIVKEKDGKARVIIAAVKRETLSGAVDLAQQANVDAVVLSSEAVTKAALLLCDDLRGEFFLLRLCEDKTKLLFVQNEKLIKTTPFDCEFPAMEEEQIREASLLCLDIQNVIDEYTVNEGTLPPLFVDGSGFFVDTVERLLNEKKIETRRIHYNFSRIGDAENAVVDLECLGLAAIAHDGPLQYDLLKGLYRKQKSNPRDRIGLKKKILRVAVCLMSIISIAVCYGADKHRLASCKKQMSTPEFSRLLETHRLRGTIAQQRMDFPELIENINHGIPEGVTIQFLTVRRFQKIAVGGTCKEPKRMYDFTEALGKCKGIRHVRISNQKFDDKKQQTTFTLTFDYKNFTDRRKSVQ